jgi:hypothetical protein
LTTLSSKVMLRDLLSMTGGEPERFQKRRRELLKQENGQIFHTKDDIAALIQALIQRAMQGGKRDNMKGIADTEVGYFARFQHNPSMTAFFPGVVVVHPDPVFVQSLPISLFGGAPTDVGLAVMVCGGAFHLLDGETREQAAALYARAANEPWILDQELPMTVLPGITVAQAAQIFVTVNGKGVPVSFDDMLLKDTESRGYALTRFVIPLLKRDGASFVRSKLAKDDDDATPMDGKIRQRAVLQFVTVTLLGAAGERKQAEYLLERGDETDQQATLRKVIGLAQEALGPERWGRTSELLIGGYGLATIGRIYHLCTDRTGGHVPPIDVDKAFQRIKAMSWDVSDDRWLTEGITAVSKDRKTGQEVRRNKLTSFDNIHRVVEIVTSDRWAEFKLAAPAATATKGRKKSK